MDEIEFILMVIQAVSLVAFYGILFWGLAEIEIYDVEDDKWH